MRQRSLESQLTPDRYYYLLVMSGVHPDEADTLRARLMLSQMKAKK